MEQLQRTWSRRKFIAAAAGTGAAMMFRPWASWAIDDVDPRVLAIVKNTFGIDTHNHIDVPLVKGEVPGPKLDLAGELKRSGLTAICMTFAVDYGQMSGGSAEGSYERYLNGMASMDAQLVSNGMKRALSFSDLKTAHDQQQPIVIQSIEGCHFLEGHLERVEEGYQRGIRHIGLLHDSDASVPLGDVYTNQPAYGGLTGFGADVIRECNRLGILVDLAHASNDTAVAAIKVMQAPFIISHTGWTPK